MDRSSRQKIKKEIPELTHTIEQINLTDIYKNFSFNSSRIHIILSANETSSRIDHVLRHKSSLNKLTSSCIFSDQWNKTKINKKKNGN
jgi:hypothetical protein